MNINWKYVFSETGDWLKYFVLLFGFLLLIHNLDVRTLIGLCILLIFGLFGKNISLVIRNKDEELEDNGLYEEDYTNLQDSDIYVKIDEDGDIEITDLEDVVWLSSKDIENLNIFIKQNKRHFEETPIL